MRASIEQEEEEEREREREGRRRRGEGDGVEVEGLKSSRFSPTTSPSFQGPKLAG